MTDLAKRLAALGPQIEELMKIGGTAGVSMGILHHGKPVFHANYGYRDVQASLPPTEETIFPAGSLTKALTSAMMGLLVEEKTINWDTLVKDVLPDFNIKDDILRNCTTIADLLSHRTGMSRSDNLWLGTDNNILISGKDSMKFLNSQVASLPFRGQFAYNNLPYELAGHIIETLTGLPWSHVVRSRIIDPLGLERTSFTTPLSTVENVAKCYNTLDDGTPTPVCCAKAGDDGFAGPCGGIRTCVNDLLKLYRVFLASANDQFASGTTSTKYSPLKQVNHLMSAKIPMHQATHGEASYGYGWARVQLPGPMGNVGNNPPLMLDGMPVVGKGGPSRLVLYHQGSLPGALAAVNLIPDTESAIIVLTNSLGLNDTADWIGQLVLEEFLEVPKRNDYIKAAKTSVAANAEWHSTTFEEVWKEQRKGTSPRSLEEYVGTYWDPIHIFKIEVSLEEQTLYWSFQGLESEKFRLDHYELDIFTWLQPRNELAARGRWVDQGAPFWKVDFQANANGHIGSLMWVHDVGVPAVVYTKSMKGTL